LKHDAEARKQAGLNVSGLRFHIVSVKPAHRRCAAGPGFALGPPAERYGHNPNKLQYEYALLDQMDARRLTVLLESAAKTTAYDSNPKLWDEVLTGLNLDLRYQLTVAEVLRRGTWRKAKNVRAYIASASVRSARGKKLPDYSEKEFRRVASGNPNDDVGTHTDSGAGFDLENWGGGGVYERTASGAIRYVDSDDDGCYREIPRWLQRGEEHDAVDWETVAAYAVLKPRMACLLARVLITRLDRRLGRPEAMARATSDKEAKAIEAAWKWIDRNADERITPLFKMHAPPRALAAQEIASFPLFASRVSLRLDIEPRWDRKKKQLVLARDGFLPVFSFKAVSKSAAMEFLRDLASDWPDPEIFHYWPMPEKVDTVEMPERLQPGAFAKPWEVLSRMGSKAFRRG